MPTLTIDLTAQQAQRVQAAFATNDNPSPDMADLKSWVVRQIRARVLQHERKVQESAITDTEFEPQ